MGEEVTIDRMEDSLLTATHPSETKGSFMTTNHTTDARDRMINTLFREIDELMAQIPKILETVDRKLALIRTYQAQREEADRGREATL